MENQPATPESFQPFDDLVAVDAHGRGHRPDGKFLSNYEVEQIGAHQELIRSMGPSAYEGRHRAPDPTETFGATEAIPALAANETNPSRLVAAKAFFGRRAAQLSRTFKRTRHALDQWYGELPDAWPGDTISQSLRLTTAQTVRAHLHPYQLGRNAKSNIMGLLGRPHDTAYDRSPAHPVVRKKLYKEAQRGNEAAIAYLGMYDRRLGQTESTLKDLAIESVAILSGAAAVRKVGLYALMGVTVGEAMLPAANSPEKQQNLQRRFEKLAAKNAIEFGTNGFVKRQRAYAEVARAAKPPYQYRDPFEAFK